MELKNMDGRRLILSKEEKDSIKHVCALLDSMAKNLNDADYDVLAGAIEATEYFDTAKEMDEDEFISEFIGYDSDCKDILRKMSALFYVLHEAT